MAGSNDPPRKGRGRPQGAFDKSRDYSGAVAKARALIANGVSGREAAKIVGEELGIPASTLRKHLARKPKRGPRINIHRELSEFDFGLETVTKEQAEEAARRYQEEESQRRKKEEARRAQAQRDAMLFQLGFRTPPLPPKKKPSK